MLLQDNQYWKNFMTKIITIDLSSQVCGYEENTYQWAAKGLHKSMWDGKCLKCLKRIMAST